MANVVFTSATEDYEKKVEKSTHNGWSNKATWHASVHVSNTEEIYNIAKQFENYTDFINLGLVTVKNLEAEIFDVLTHDDINLKELNQMIQELS